MKVVQKLLAAILTAALCASVVFAATSHDYTGDSPVDCYYDNIAAIEESGIYRYDTDKLDAQATVTVAELARMIFDACDIYVPLSSFGEAWQVPYLERLGAFTGDVVKDRVATRYDAAVFLYKILQLPDDASDAKFNDEESNVCLNAVKAAGLMDGEYVNGEVVFCGANQLTRAELLSIGNHVLKYTKKSPTLLNCAYYNGISNIGTLIPANVTLPKNPMTKEAMSQVIDYMAVNNLTELTIPYTFPYQKTSFHELLREVNREHAFELPEYFGYNRYLTYSISYQAENRNAFNMNLKFSPQDSSLIDGAAKRAEAFTAANAMYQELYNSGKLSKDMSEKERAKVILKELADKTVYKNDETSACHTAWSVFSRGYGVCDGISAAYQTLLRLDGIQCWGVLGKSLSTNGTHLWTAAVLDGELSYTDSTWGVCWKDYDVYHFFAMTEEQCRKTHSW